MSLGQVIERELSLGEVVSKTFDLYRQNFVKYFILFAVVELIVGVLNTLVSQAVVVPSVPTNPASPDYLSSFGAYFGAFITLEALLAIISLIFLPIAEASTVKLASDEMVKGESDLGTSVRFAISKLIWVWVLGLIVGIIVFLGFLALIVPGIILTIMFSLALPALLIEDRGVFASLGRSRELVGHRWLKTFATFLVFGIIVVIVSLVLSLAGELFGVAGTVATSILSAFYQPIIPIALTVYYYSNRARVATPQTGQIPTAPGMIQAGTKFCPNCGAQLDSATIFCPKCGARQPG
jgi:hypothetical protein